MRNLFSLFILASVPAVAEPLLITGKVSSNQQQVVVAPQTDRWQIQVQWLMEEGAIAQKDELIATFDSGDVKTQIKQSEESLASAQLELKKKKLELKQALVEAQGELAVADLELQKAGIEASISSDEVSEYDKGQYKLAYERAVFSKVKAEQKVQVKQKEYETGIAKQKIEITKIEENLAYQKKTLERVSVKATVTGPVSHAYHPWNGDKITAGSLVQQSMKVLTVQGQGGYQVIAWVHEVDVNKLVVGDVASLSLDAFPSMSYRGTVVEIASQSEQKDEWSDSPYHQIKVNFEHQPDQKLLPGMSVRVLIDKDMS